MNPAAARTPQTWQRAATLAGLVIAALVSAVIRAAAGLAFLISLAARRPLIAAAAEGTHFLSQIR